MNPIVLFCDIIISIIIVKSADLICHHGNILYLGNIVIVTKNTVNKREMFWTYYHCFKSKVYDWLSDCLSTQLYS